MLKPKAQSTLEYAVVIASIVAGLLAMQVYIKRSLSGKLKVTADGIGSQYDPRTIISDITTELTSEVSIVSKTESITNKEGKEVRRNITRVITGPDENNPGRKPEVRKIQGTESIGVLPK